MLSWLYSLLAASSIPPQPLGHCHVDLKRTGKNRLGLVENTKLTIKVQVHEYLLNIAAHLPKTSFEPLSIINHRTCLACIQRHALNGLASKDEFLYDWQVTNYVQLKVFWELETTEWRDDTYFAAVYNAAQWNIPARAKSFADQCTYPITYRHSRVLLHSSFSERTERTLAPLKEALCTEMPNSLLIYDRAQVDRYLSLKTTCDIIAHPIDSDYSIRWLDWKSIDPYDN